MATATLPLPTCRICSTALGEEFICCPACDSPAHPDCWRYNHGCATYGCVCTTPAQLRDLDRLCAEITGGAPVKALGPVVGGWAPTSRSGYSSGLLVHNLVESLFHVVVIALYVAMGASALLGAGLLRLAPLMAEARPDVMALAAGLGMVAASMSLLVGFWVWVVDALY